MNNLIVSIHLLFNVNNVDLTKIEKYITRVNPRHNKTTVTNLAININKSAIKWEIDPMIMTRLIAAESHFKFGAKSNTGDFSLVQINCKIWTKEFRNLRRRKLDCIRLVKDPAYALDRMAEILSIVKKRSINKYWYLGYHSNTKKLRLKYLKNIRKND